jgi:hypothetical protein
MSSKVGVWIYAAVLVVAGALQCDVLAAATNAPRAGDVGQIAVLYRRIRNAAEHVCGFPQPPGSNIPSIAWRTCVADSVERSVIAVDRPALTIYYRSHRTLSDQRLLALAAASLKR